MMMQLDQFFTPPALADRLVSLIDPERYAVIIEPSAGSGAILAALRRSGKRLPPVHAYDMEPHGEGIEQGNWLNAKDTTGRLRKDFYIEPMEKARRWHRALVIGNPPFCADREFLHESSFADTIAFILPISFMKIGHAERYIGNHHRMTHVEEVPADTQYQRPDGKKAKVPTCIAIFEWTAERQDTGLLPLPPLPFVFVKDRNDAQYGIVRAGARAGMLLPPENCPHTAYWIRQTDPTVNLPLLFIRAAQAMQMAAMRTIGAPSVNHQEVAAAITAAMGA
jgi:hypothetical protein